MNATKIDVEGLRAKAEGASPGVWTMFIPDRGYCYNYVLTDDPDRAPTDGNKWRHLLFDANDCGHGEANAAYIVAAQPQTMIALLDRIAELEGALLDLEQRCDHLAETRTRETYLAMLADGQSEALSALDASRRHARTTLSGAQS